MDSLEQERNKIWNWKVSLDSLLLRKNMLMCVVSVEAGGILPRFLLSASTYNSATVSTGQYRFTVNSLYRKVSSPSWHWLLTWRWKGNSYFLPSWPSNPWQGAPIDWHSGPKAWPLWFSGTYPWATLVLPPGRGWTEDSMKTTSLLSFFFFFFHLFLLVGG